jgi:hypothetical protein
MARSASVSTLRWFWLSLAFPLAVACGNKQASDDDAAAGTGGATSPGQGGTTSNAGHAPGGAPGTGGTGGTGAGTGGAISTGGGGGSLAAGGGGHGGSLAAGSGGGGGLASGGLAGAGVAGQVATSGGGGQPAGQGGAAGATLVAGAGGSAGGGAAGMGAAGASATGFFMDDFESGTVGMQPPGWDNFIAYVKNNSNPSGTTLALVDTMHVHGGTKAVHFHGDSNPAQIVKALASGMTKLYVRAWFYMTRKLGQQTDMSANHESLVVLRRVSGMASDEVRFGEIKGTVGVNEVPSDNIAPIMDKWHQATGPLVAANTWACIEVAFLADSSPNTLRSWQNGSTLFDVTSVGTDQWQNGTMPADWLAKKFAGTPAEIVLGWQSFSSAANDVWMDDLVLSTSPIGCN